MATPRASLGKPSDDGSVPGVQDLATDSGLACDLVDGLAAELPGVTIPTYCPPGIRPGGLASLREAASYLVAGEAGGTVGAPMSQCRRI